MMLVAVLTAIACNSTDPATRLIQETVEVDEPISIATSCIGDFSQGASWYLSVNSAGEAELTIRTLPEPKRRKFLVPRAKITALRQALEKERFFELAGEYGEHVPDSSSDSITIVMGGQAESVVLRFLMNWVNGDKTKLHEPSRAVRISMMIRNWFDVEEAVDLRGCNQLVLDAVKKDGKMD